MSALMRDRARRGAAWLDQNLPGWFLRVNPQQLDIEFCNTCVIGQLHGDYNDWKEPKKDFAVKHGFFVRHRATKNWAKQTAAWREEIAARRRDYEVQYAQAV